MNKTSEKNQSLCRRRHQYHISSQSKCTLWIAAIIYSSIPLFSSIAGPIIRISGLIGLRSKIGEPE